MRRAFVLIGPFGIALQGGLGFGYAILNERTSLGADLDASSTKSRVPMLQLELGYSF